MKERILSYLQGDMDADERKLFEHELMRDKLLEEIQDRNVLDLPTQKKVRRISIKRKHLMAVGLVLMMVGIWVVFKGPSKSSNEKIFASYYHPYKSENNSLYRAAATTNNFIDAVNLYDSGNYQTAVAKFQTVIKNNTTDLDSRFFMGLSFIELKNYGKAIDNLSNVINQNDIFFVTHAEWYLALCYLKINQTGKAISLLNKIACNENEYQAMALEILKKLK
jgi:tetratricopeptide (TPR) repeat protein